MQLTPNQIAGIVSADKDAVVFVTLAPGINPRVYESVAKLLTDLATATKDKGDYFPRVIVMPPGVQVDVLKQPQSIVKAVAAAQAAAEKRAQPITSPA